MQYFSHRVGAAGASEQRVAAADFALPAKAGRSFDSGQDRVMGPLPLSRSGVHRSCQ